MKTNKKPFPLSTVSAPKGIRQRIDTNPDFQRHALSLNKLFQPKEAFQQSLKSFFAGLVVIGAMAMYELFSFIEKNTTA